MPTIEPRMPEIDCAADRLPSLQKVLASRSSEIALCPDESVEIPGDIE